MPRDGAGGFNLNDGTRSGANVCQQQKAAGLDVTASLMDNILADIGTALTASIAKDGQTTITADLPLAGFKLTNAGAATTATDATRADQVQNGSLFYAGTAGGTANALTLTLTPTPAAYVAGEVIRFIAGATNTAAVTINKNSLGAKDLRTKLDSAVAVGSGELVIGGVYEVMYDGTQYRLLGQINGLGYSAVTAGGTTKADAGAMVQPMSQITGGTPGAGVRLPIAPRAGYIVALYNNHSNTYKVYSPTGTGQISGLGTSAGMDLAPGQGAILVSVNDGSGSNCSYALVGKATP